MTHGQVDVMVRWLREQGLQAQGFVTEYGDEEGVKELDAETGKVTGEPGLVSGRDPEGKPP